MIEVEQIQKRLYQDILEVRQYVTQNSWGQHSNLRPGEYRQIENFELYDQFIKERRGTDFLRPEFGSTKSASEKIKQRIVWDVGDEQYLLYYQNNRMYSQQVDPTPGNPVLIQDFSASPFFIGTALNTFQPDFFLEFGKLYVFHSEENAIIEFDAGIFKGRSMGMMSPSILSVTNIAPGSVGGTVTYGIEKVYQKTDYDVLASSPNRIKVDRTFATIDIGFVSLSTIEIAVDPTELENDTLWTHVRLWRSKSQTSDTTNINVLLSAVGTEDSLFEVALITRAEMTSALGPIAESTDALLPPGNANTQAGQPSGVGTTFIIYDGSNDDFLFDNISVPGLDLIPIPPANLGVSQSNRIFFADLGTNILSDGTVISADRKDSVWYSDTAVGPRSEQFNKVNVLPTPLDGQKVTKLISFEKELIILKEARTLRILGGDVTIPIEELDQKIGTANKDFIEFVPTLGIVGKTSDYGDFRIFGFDFVWRSTFNGIEISKPIRNEMNTLIGGETSIIYINGKILIGDRTGLAYVLNVEQGLGWSQFQYVSDATDQYFVFANGSRAGIAGGDKFLMEIEVEDLTTDVNYRVDPVYAGAPIDCIFITHQFRSSDGADVIEHEWLSIMAKVEKSIFAVPYCNSVEWPTPDVESQSNFVLDPAFFSAIDRLNDREHRLFIAPEQQGIFLFNRMIGNFLHYKISTVAPCTFKKQNLHVIVDEDGIAWGNFDPFQVLPESDLIGDIIETGTAVQTYTETGISTDEILEDANG